MQRVLIESGNDDKPDRCRRYEFTVLRDSLERGESPVSISLIHSLVQPEADLQAYTATTDHSVEWLHSVHGLVLYADLGISPRMRALKEAAQRLSVPVEIRSIDNSSWR